MIEVLCTQNSCSIYLNFARTTTVIVTVCMSISGSVIFRDGGEVEGETCSISLLLSSIWGWLEKGD